jgi:plasmid stabilization system protein ParE
VRQFIVRPAAAADMDEAYSWYEAQRPGLGAEFLSALSSTREQIRQYPEANAVLFRTTRRALLPRRFPYALFYRVYDDAIIIVACLHAGRDPRRWQERD